MTAAPSMHGKGIFFVNSKISRTDILDVKTFMTWYEEDHIPEILATSGVQSARRFVNIDPAVEKPYLAIYPLEDLGFSQTEEFLKIHVTSDILPGDGTVYDLADFEVRYDNLVEVHDETKKGRGVIRCLVVVACELKEGTSTDELDDWYRKEQYPLMAKHKSYLRTTRFKLVYARSNAQSRVLKGLVASTTEGPPKPATWLCLHEFECEADELNTQEFQDLASSPWSDRMLANFGVYNVNVYKLANEFGDKDFFHEVAM